MQIAMIINYQAPLFYLNLSAGRGFFLAQLTLWELCLHLLLENEHYCYLFHCYWYLAKQWDKEKLLYIASVCILLHYYVFHITSYNNLKLLARNQRTWKAEVKDFTLHYTYLHNTILSCRAVRFCLKMKSRFISLKTRFSISILLWR